MIYQILQAEMINPMVVIPESESTGIISLYQSPIGKKILTGLTGVGLVSFVVVHLLGNLALFVSAEAYNDLAYVIERLGPVTYAVEIGLVAIALLHAFIGIKIYIGKQQARPLDYTKYVSAGEPSRQTLSSRTMIASGLILAVFLVVHLATFKFGPYYSLPESGHRDLARLVFETFHKPGYTAGYVLVLAMLGLHLRHGLWSAWQSLGVPVQPGMVAVSVGAAGAIALGFMGLPLAIYFGLIG